MYIEVFECCVATYGSFNTVRHCFLTSNIKLHLDMHGVCTVRTFVNDV